MVSFSWNTIEFVSICFVIIVIILLTVGGNLVVLFAFYTEPHLLTPSNNFLLSMAIADLLVGLIAMPFYSYAQIKPFWPFGKFFCKIWLTIDDVATMASVLSIVAITIERYWSINHSVHYRRYTTKTRIRIFSILIWFIPFLNFAPGIWFLESHEDIQTQKNHTECIGAYHSNTLYLIIAQINFFAWPLVVIIILNALIVVNLYRRSYQFPTYGSILEQGKNNILKEDKEKKIDEHQQQQQQRIENDEPTFSMINENNLHMSKKMNLKYNHENHYANIPPSIKEVDELMMEEDIIRSQPSQPIPVSLSIEIDTKQSSNLYTRFKRVLLPSSIIIQSTSNDRHSTKSTQTSHAPAAKQKPRSIFACRNSSFPLSRNNTNSNTVTGEQRNVRRLKRDKRAATSLLILVLVFMIFLLPYVVVVVVGNIFSLEFLTNTNGQVYSAAFWLLWLNSTVNPILYPFIQPKFRDAYRKIFLRLTRRRRRLVSLIIDIQRNK